MTRVKILFFISISLSIVTKSFCQKVDKSVFQKLLNTDSTGFLDVAKEVGLVIGYDNAARCLFAKSKGIVYTKPLSDKGNDYYFLGMIVSTLDKNNNKLIIDNAKPVEGKNATWVSEQNLFIEWDTENPVTKEMW